MTPRRKVRCDSNGKKGTMDLMLLVFVSVALLAAIVIGGYLVPLKINEIVNIRSKLAISVTNDYAGTELVALLNNKAGNVKYMELIGSYMAQGLEDSSEYIKPFQDTLKTVFRKYAFEVTGTNVAFQNEVPSEFQDATKRSISMCDTSLPKAVEDTKASFNLVWPSEAKTISSGFGGRDLYKDGTCSCHPGIDISGDSKKVFAAADGTVIATYTTCVAGKDKASQNCNGGYGNYIVVKHAIAGSTYYTYYDHLKTLSSSIKNGVTVKAGDEIAVSGNTGTSTGPHLHFELRSAGQQRLKDSVIACKLFADQASVPSNCEHEPVAVCTLVTGTTVKSFQTDIPLPGPRAGAEAKIRGQVVFKQWS